VPTQKVLLKKEELARLNEDIAAGNAHVYGDKGKLLKGEDAGAADPLADGPHNGSDDEIKESYHEESLRMLK